MREREKTFEKALNRMVNEDSARYLLERVEEGQLKVPVIPDIHKRVLDAVVRPGALDMRDWHICKTTHCRAGWVVALAGKEGFALEKALDDTSAAANLIYAASDPSMTAEPDYGCSNDDAMASIITDAGGLNPDSSEFCNGVYELKPPRKPSKQFPRYVRVKADMGDHLILLATASGNSTADDHELHLGKPVDAIHLNLLEFRQLYQKELYQKELYQKEL